MDEDITRYCLKKGELVKEGHVNKAFKSRLFVLTSSELSYMEGDKVKGKIPLTTITDVKPTTIEDNQFAFCINTGEEFGKDFIVCANSEENRKEWIDAILAAKDGRPIADSVTQVFTKIEDDSLADPKKYYDNLLTSFISARSDSVKGALLRFTAFYTRCADCLLFTYAEMTKYREQMIKILTHRKSDWCRTGDWTEELKILCDDMIGALDNACDRLNIHLTGDDMQNTIIPTYPSGQSNGGEKRVSRGIPKRGFSDEYIIKERLGAGAFSEVHKCINKKSGVVFAVKVIKKHKMKQSDLESIKNEVYLLGTLDHPNIVRLESFFDEPDNYYIVTELADGGELFDEIVNRHFYSEVEARKIVHTLLETLNYIHNQNIAHRDLKPENILLSKTTKELKLADFGFAKNTEQTDTGRLMTDCGSPWYVAPEILKGHLYGTQVDMWSLGVIIYILLCGTPPFHDSNQARLFKKIKNCDYKFFSPNWDTISENAKDLIRHLLEVDPSKRYDCKQCLAHPWFKQDNKEMSDVPLNVAQHELKSFNIERRGIYKQGYLTKQGHIIKNWKKRSFVLTSDNLRYYKSETEKKPQGIIAIDDVIRLENGQQDNMFIIRTKSKKDFWILAPNENERDEWIYFINLIRRCKQMKDIVHTSLSTKKYQEAIELLWEMRRQRNMSHDYPLLKLWSALSVAATPLSVGSIYMIQGFDQPSVSNYTALTCGLFQDYSDEIIPDTKDPTRVIAGDEQGHVYIYDYNNTQVFDEKVSEAAISVIKVSYPLYICICGSQNGSLSFIDIYNQEYHETIQGHNAAITSIDIDTASNRFITGDEDGTFILWDLDKKRILKKVNPNNSAIRYCQFRKEGRNICVATRSGSVYVYDTLSLETLFIYTVNKPIVGIHITITNNVIICCESGDIYIFSDKHKECFKHYLINEDIHHFVISSDERYIIIYGAYISMYNLFTGVQEAYMDIKNEISTLCLSYVNNVFYINQNNTIEKWYVDMIYNYENKTYTPPTEINDDYSRVENKSNKSPISVEAIEEVDEE